ncbi:MAG TPA: hypothetical protein PKG77_13325, partial [Phycisphaerae bacterium]|nr:hypothetical protein [Phycisphaerae bacterium]
MADPKNNPPPRVVVASQRLPRRRFKTNLRILIYRPGTFLRFYRWPLVVLAIGAVLDAVTTYRNVSAYGPAAEIHPAARLLWEILGVSPVSVALA